jgi:hypothetical protein
MSTNNSQTGGVSKLLGAAENLTLLASDFVTNITLTAISGTLTIQGPGTFRGQPSDPIILPEGSIVTLQAQSGGVLVGWSFTAETQVGILINQ